MNNYFPTDFAQSVCRSVDLFYKGDMAELDAYGYSSKKVKGKKKKAKKAMDQFARLVDFQMLSISGKFKECLVAYEGYELTKEQRQRLKLIHKTTVLWLKGELSDRILDKIHNANSGREIKDMTQTMMILMGIEDGDGKKVDDSKFKALVVQTYTEEK